MKLTLLFAAALLVAFPLFAQAPVNDAFNCGTMVDLGVAPACPGTIFTNVNATPSIIATLDTVSCFNSATAQRDVWFKFTCSDTLFDYRIYLKSAGGDPIENAEFAIYRGDCQFNGLGEVACVRANVGEDSISVDLFGLTPNELYYIRVSDWSSTAAPNSGEFTLCVDKIPPILTINQGGSPLCEGTLYDTGGANGDYSSNEDFTFVICPDQPSECIAFTLEYYHLEPSLPQSFPPGQGDQLSFYDGSSVNSPLLASLDGTGFSQENIAGGGGVCFQVHATSGCLTVRFESDGSVQEEGWKGTWACSSDPCKTEETIDIDTSFAASDIEGAVSTGGAMVTVTSVNCPQGGMGTFQYPSDQNVLNMEKGLLLTSGQALNAIGPNNGGGTSSQNEPFFSEDPGDPDLQYLSSEYGGGSTSYDVCTVELDVFAATNEVVFEYVFGSEEYPEYVFSPTGFNDIFAFLVSGPGIAGDPNLTNSALNIAVLPNTATLVQIDSVNNQVNWQYYRNNELSQTIEYDGLTSDLLGVKKSLTARVPVTPCNTYHLKLAIADRGDESFDSGVFVSEIKAGSPDIKIAFSSGVDYFIENCTGSNDTLFLTLDKVPTEETTFNIGIGGTATEGLDYTLNIPPSITFLPGQQTLSFPIVPLVDNLVEGAEFITVTLSRNYGCGEVALKSVKVQILDNVLVQVEGGDTLTMCKGDFLQLTATGASNYVWEPQDQVSNAYIPNPFTSPSQSLWLELTGSVGACLDKDSVFIRVISPTIEATNLTPNTICLGGTVALQATSSEPNITWSPVVGLDDPNSASPIASPTFPVTYTATVNLAGCTVQASVSVIVDTLFFPNVIDDLLQCQNFPVQLANTLNTSSTYAWEPATGLSDPTVSGPIALPDQSTTYVLTATSINGVCEKIDTVVLSITPADVNILGPDTLKICLGADSIELMTNVNPGGFMVHWYPTDYLSSSTGDSVKVAPLESVTITASYQVTGCPPVLDSVYIRVDSLPDLTIFAVPEKPFYCSGDTIYLLSNLYNPGNAASGFPGIQHQWDPFGTQLTPLDKFQMILIATDTNLYKRTTTIGACSETASILINVPAPPLLPYTVQPNPICPGEVAQIVVTPSPVGTTLEWDEASSGTLSCDDCGSPLASPLVTTTYRVTTPDALCPSGADIVVQVAPLPLLNLVDQTSCAGDPKQLNSTNESDVIYHWTPGIFLNDTIIGNPTATPTQPGVYTYHVDADKNGCKVEGTVTLTAYLANIEVTTPPQNLCAGTPLSLAVTTTGTAGTIGWLPAGPEVVPTETTTYTATLFYGMGCVDQDDVTINVIPLPLLDLANNPVSCAGAPVILNNTNELGVSYAWTPPSFLNSAVVGNPTATPTQPGVYTYQVEANRAGCKTLGSVTLSAYNATISVTTLPQDVCAGTALALTATTTGTPGSINWSPAGPNVLPTSPVTYTATLQYGVGCSVEDSVAINVIPLPVINLTVNPTVCLGTGVSLNTTNDPGVVYFWTPTNGLSNPAIGNPTATPLVTTPYHVEATSIQGSCKSEGDVTVNVANASVSAGVDQTICFGATATLTAVVTGTGDGTIQWTGNQSGNPIQVQPSIDQPYTVTYLYGPNNICSDVDDVTLFVGEPLGLSNITGPEDSICAGASVLLKVSITDGMGSISWLADGLVVPGQTLDSVMVTPQGSTVQYKAVLTDASGCSATSEPITVNTKKCFEVPNAFTPNGDAANDTFGPLFLGGKAEVLSFSVYNRWGQKVFESTPQQVDWDGKQDGKDASSDVYVYTMRVRFGNGEEETRSGEVTLLR